MTQSPEGRLLVVEDDPNILEREERHFPVIFLRYVLLNPQRVLSTSQILDHVGHDDVGGDGNVVESYVSYLRRRVDTTEPRLLHTLRGVGHVLRTPRT